MKPFWRSWYVSKIIWNESWPLSAESRRESVVTMLRRVGVEAHDADVDRRRRVQHAHLGPLGGRLPSIGSLWMKD